MPVLPNLPEFPQLWHRDAHGSPSLAKCGRKWNVARPSRSWPNSSNAWHSCAILGQINAHLGWPQATTGDRIRPNSVKHGQAGCGDASGTAMAHERRWREARSTLLRDGGTASCLIPRVARSCLIPRVARAGAEPGAWSAAELRQGSAPFPGCRTVDIGGSTAETTTPSHSTTTSTSTTCSPSMTPTSSSSACGGLEP